VNSVLSLFRVCFIENTFARLAALVLMLSSFVACTTLIKDTAPGTAISVGIVITEWASENSRSVERKITNKIAKELKNVRGLKRLQSDSYTGLSLIVVEFNSNVKLSDAMTNMRAKVVAAAGELPHVAKKPKVMEAFISDTSIYSIRLSGEVDLGIIGAIAKNLQQDLEYSTGVNTVSISRERDQIIQIRLMGARLAAYGIAPAEAHSALDHATVALPLGDFYGATVGTSFRFLSRFQSIVDIRRLAVGTTPTGRTVVLGELAEIKPGPKQEVSRSYFAENNGEIQEALDITLTKRPGVNTIKTIWAVERIIQRHQAKASWPTMLQTTVVAN
jgi:HAE1 family hydrophobic/amphiphilic exporter-1